MPEVNPHDAPVGFIAVRYKERTSLGDPTCCSQCSIDKSTSPYCDGNGAGGVSCLARKREDGCEVYFAVQAQPTQALVEQIRKRKRQAEGRIAELVGQELRALQAETGIGIKSVTLATIYKRYAGFTAGEVIVSGVHIEVEL